MIDHLRRTQKAKSLVDNGSVRGFKLQIWRMLTTGIIASEVNKTVRSSYQSSYASWCQVNLISLSRQKGQ